MFFMEEAEKQSQARLTLLGGFQLRDAAGIDITIKAKKAKALLAYLALQTSQPQPREKLATLLWDESGEEQARQSLRQALAGLRKVLPETMINADGDYLQIDPTCLNMDVVQFEHLASESSSDALAQAVELYQGELLEGLNPRADLFDEWLLAERFRLREKVLDVMERLLSTYLDANQHEQAIKLALRLLSLDPLRESVHRITMKLYTRRGQYSAALKQYRQCRRSLQRELGVIPEAETELLYEKILDQRKRPGTVETKAVHEPQAPNTAQQTEVLEIESKPIELRHATVMSLHLNGFAQLNEVFGAEELHNLLSRYYEIVDNEVVNQGGTIAKHFGDLVIALFGVPQTRDDDNYRALLVTDTLRQKLTSAFKEENLQAQIGLASGQLLAGDLGSSHFREYSVVGSAVNLAERLARQANAGEVLVADGLYQSIATHVDASQLESNSGWQINALLHSAATKQSLIGRKRELRLFKSALEECLETEHGEAFFIRGEAGIGKTHLLEVFADLARSQGYAVHLGVCRGFGVNNQDLLQNLVISLVQMLAQGDIETVQSNNIIPAEHTPFLLDLLGLPQETTIASTYEAMQAESRRSGKQAVLNQLLEAASAQQPLLLLIEDIHWADSGTLLYLAKLVQAAGKLPLLLVMTSRIEGEPLDPAWRGAMQGASLTTLDLRLLRDDEMQALANSYSDNSVLIQRCVERSAGNPFFLLQLLQDISGADEQIPDSIQVLILAQLDRLSVKDKQAAQAAAVLGQRVALTALRYLLEDDTYSSAALIQAGMLRPEGDQLIFSHALIQECVYASLLQTQLTKLHQCAADWYSERDAVLHAEHLERANNPTAAAAYLTAAKAVAAEYKLHLAQELLKRGLSLKDKDEFDLAQMLAELQHESGYVDDAINNFDRAYQSTTEPLQQCRALTGKAACLHLRDEYQTALTILAQAELLTEKLDAIEERARIAYLRGNVLFPLGHLDECLAAHSQALEYANQCGSLELEARALSGLGDAYYMRGQMITANDYFSRCVDLCRLHDFRQIEVNNLSMRGLTAMYLNNLTQGIDDNLRCIELAQQIGNRRAELGGRDILGLMYYLNGRLDQAQLHNELGVALAQQLGARRFETDCVGSLASISFARGNQAEAETLITRAWKLSGDDLAYVGAWLLGEMARITTDADKRIWALAEGERLLAHDAVSHNYLHFYDNAIHTSICQQAWGEAERYAEALQHYTEAEPLPWTELIIELGRLAAKQGKGEVVTDALTDLQQEYHRNGIHHADAIFALLGVD